MHTRGLRPPPCIMPCPCTSFTMLLITIVTRCYFFQSVLGVHQSVSKCNSLTRTATCLSLASIAQTFHLCPIYQPPLPHCFIYHGIKITHPHTKHVNGRPGPVLPLAKNLVCHDSRCHRLSLIPRMCNAFPTCPPHVCLEEVTCPSLRMQYRQLPVTH